MDINYKDTIEEIIAFMEKNTNITLATSLTDRVTARTVAYINDGLDVYFTSFGFNKKIQQIMGNPNVALNLKHIQIEGLADVFGWPLPEDVKLIEDKFIAKYKWFSKVADGKDFVIVKISPKKIVIFKSIDGVFHLQNVDLEKKKAYQMKLADKDAPNYPY